MLAIDEVQEAYQAAGSSVYAQATQDQTNYQPSGSDFAGYDQPNGHSANGYSANGQTVEGEVVEGEVTGTGNR